jgi:hypothetical protein
VESGALLTIIPLWDPCPGVSCSAPEPAASCGAFAPHAGIDVLGVDDVPAVKQAPPAASQVFAVDADSVKGSLSSVVLALTVSTRRRTTAERSDGRATARTAAGSTPFARNGNTDAQRTQHRARRNASLENNRYSSS